MSRMHISIIISPVSITAENVDLNEAAVEKNRCHNYHQWLELQKRGMHILPNSLQAEIVHDARHALKPVPSTN